MLLDPLNQEASARYPDDSLVPTGMVSLLTTNTYTTTDTNFQTWLRWKVTDPATLPTIRNPTPLAVAATYSDYGAPAEAWLDVSAIDRTLACGIRVRVTGLPVSTFVPSGVFYFLQLQQDEIAAFYADLAASGESVARQAVVANKGFSCTTSEVQRADAGVTLSYLPQGPMSFVYSDTNSYTAGNATGGPLSSNGFLVVVAFGLQVGQVFTIDYGHKIEYVPRYGAGGLIATKLEPPNSRARDIINTAVGMVGTERSGSTSLADNPIIQGITQRASEWIGDKAMAVMDSVMPGSAAMASELGLSERFMGHGLITGASHHVARSAPWLRTVAGMLGFN